MDSKGRLRYLTDSENEFVGMTYAETGAVDEAGCIEATVYREAPANRKARRAQAAFDRSAEARADRAHLDRLLRSFGPVPEVKP